MSGLAGRIAARLDALEVLQVDPAAVLRLVDGLRAAVGLHAAVSVSRYSPGVCESCADWGDVDFEGPPRVAYPCATLCGIAAALGVEVGE